MKLIITIVLCSTLFLLVFMSCGKPEATQTVVELLSLGEKYLLELDYKQAIVQFLKVIEIEPANPRGYTGAAEAYLGLGQVEDAIVILEKGFSITGDIRIRTMLDEQSSQQSGGEDLNPNHYPGVTSMNETQQSNIEPLIDAVLSMDYIRVYDCITSSEEFWEMCESIKVSNSERILFLISEIADVKLALRCGTVYDGYSSAELLVLRGDKDEGLVFKALLQNNIYDPYIKGYVTHCNLTTYTYSHGVANGVYRHIEYQVNDDVAFGHIEEGSVANGLKHGSILWNTIHIPNEPERYDDSPSQYKITFVEGYVSAIEPVNQYFDLSRDVKHSIDASFYPLF